MKKILPPTLLMTFMVLMIISVQLSIIYIAKIYRPNSHYTIIPAEHFLPGIDMKEHTIHMGKYGLD